MYFLYILKCKDGSLYTGITTNVERRFAEHKNGKGARYTKSRKAVKILYTEKHKNRSSALRREIEIKGWKKDKKLALVSNGKTNNNLQLDTEVTKPNV